MKGLFRVLTVAALVGLVVGLLAGCASAPPKYPNKPIELVVPYDPGGGTDNMYRAIVKVIEDEKLSPVAINVVNKSGGGGAVGKNYARNKPADGYTLAAVDTGNVTQPLLGEAEWNYQKDFTYIARMVTDVNLIVVKADSPFKTLKDLVDKAKTKEKAVSMAGTGSGGNVDYIAYTNFDTAAGVKINYVPYKSGGEVLTNLLGGHVDAAWANPNECIGQLEAGQVRALAVANTERVKSLPDIKTVKEEIGVEMVSTQWRAVGGPGNLPKEVTDWWVATLDKVRNTTAWKENYLKKQVLEDGWLTMGDFAKLVDGENDFYTKVFGDMGLLKKK